MHTIFEQLAQVQAAGRRREKIVLLRRFDSPTLRDTLIYAMSPALTFGFKHLPFDPDCGAVGYPSLTDFLLLCIDLENRSLTGAAALAAVLDHLGSYPPSTRTLVASLFTKTFSLGCDPAVVNEALPGTLMLFGMQLGRVFHANKMVYPAYARPAFAGRRCLMFVTRLGARGMSSCGNPIESIQHLNEAFRACPPGVYDGMLTYEYEDFKFHLNVLDFIPMAEWDKPVTPTGVRLERLWDIYDKQLYRNPTAAALWHVIDHTLIKNNLELKQYHEQNLRSGWEGSIVVLDRSYKKCRTYTAMRMR